MYKKYQAAEKVMPYNAKKLVTNLDPVVTFKGDEVIIREQYFYKGEIKERNLVKNLSSGKITRRKIRELPKKEIPYDEFKTIPNVSPDGRYGLYADHYNLILKDYKKDLEYPLTNDGSEDKLYGTYFRRAFDRYKKRNMPTSIVWSSDSKKAIVNITLPKNIGTLTVTQVFNNEDPKVPMHPKDYVYHDYFPFEKDSDELNQLAIIDVEKKTIRELDKEPFYINEWGALFHAVKWDQDNNGFIFVEGDKYYKKKTLNHVSLDDFKVVEWGSEETDTFFQEMTIHGFMRPDFGYGIYVLKNQKQAIWVSKQVDLGDIYIYDFEKKDLIKKLTTDDYHVSTLLGVDEENGIVYFMGSCLKEMSDPYYGALCSIKFDGTDFKVYTKEDAMHSITLNIEKGVYVDTYSRCDCAPVTKLGYLDGREGEILLEANIAKLLKAGYILPKRTKITLEDGMTLYGCIILPHNYNENKKYPVIDYCYGGPQTINTPKKFTAWGDIPGREAYGGLEAFAALGFIGVIIDGRGTPDRGKKMHDYSYKNLHGLNGLCDHQPFITKLAQEYKGIDLDRVGIWGNSAGGYMSTRAMLEYPDFFKVAVSSAGDHDNQIYNATWAFRYHGPYEKDVYLAQDSAQLVNNLKGHLLLCHGLLDDNVHPSQTFRMIQYFNQANKTVDLMVLPDTDHNCPGNVYFMKRRFDYFVKHLMGKEPPIDFRFSGQN